MTLLTPGARASCSHEGQRNSSRMAKVSSWHRSKISRHRLFSASHCDDGKADHGARALVPDNRRV